MTSELIDLYKQRKPDGHFFDRDTMRFFNSRIGSVTYSHDRAYFVTSERGPDRVRRYTARVMDIDGDIHDIGGFQRFSTSARAFRACEQAALRQVSAAECGAGKLAVECILQAKATWEKAGGSITEECKQQRQNADHWAKQCGAVLHWDSITPDFTRSNGERVMFSQFAILIGA